MKRVYGLIIPLALGLSLTAGKGQGLEFQVYSLIRKDLPDGFPFQALFDGFAILKVEIQNDSGENRQLDLEGLRILDPKGRELERASPFDVTPKIVKYYRGNQRGIFGEGYAGGQPTPQEWERVPTVSPRSSGTTYSIETPKRIRATLEHYELKPGEIPAGDTFQGLLYVKSSEVGNKLSGSIVIFGALGSATVP